MCAVDKKVRDGLSEIGGEQNVEPPEGLTLGSRNLETDIEERYEEVTCEWHHTEEDGCVDSWQDLRKHGGHAAVPSKGKKEVGRMG